MVKNFFTEYKHLIISYLLSLFSIAMISLFTPIRFSSFKKNDSLSGVWYFITSTGDINGLFMILTVAFMSLSAIYFFKSKKLFPVIKVIALFTFVLVSLSFLNHSLLKKLFSEKRPSVIYMEQRLKIVEQDTTLTDVNPDVLEAWQRSRDYSFPSGHSFSSNFIAVFFSFLILSLIRNAYRFLYLIPLLWAFLVSLSRVIIGIHYASDVIAGSFGGILCGFIFVFFVNRRNIFKTVQPLDG